MCTASRPKLPPESAPPPMIVPEAVSEETQKKRRDASRRLQASEGQQSTVMVPANTGPVTGQQKSLLGA